MDTVRGTIEVKARKAVRWVANAVLRRKVENEVRAERELARRVKARAWETAKANTRAIEAMVFYVARRNRLPHA